MHESRLSKLELESKTSSGEARTEEGKNSGDTTGGIGIGFDNDGSSRFSARHVRIKEFHLSDGNFV